MLRVGAEALGVRVLGAKKRLSKSQAWQALDLSGQSQSSLASMPLSQAWQEPGLLEQLRQQGRRSQARQVWQERARLDQFRFPAMRARLLQAWQVLDLSERLLLPVARLLLLVVMQALERLALLRSRAQRVSKSLGSKLKVASEAFQLQDKQAYLLRVLRRRER